MFLFSADANLLDLERRVGASSEHLQALKLGNGLVLWSVDKFTTCQSNTTTFLLEIKRPTIDDQPICTFEWDFRRGVSISRRWSGEFGVLLTTDPCVIVASHAKLAARMLKPDVRLRQIAAGTTTQISSKDDGSRKSPFAFTARRPKHPRLPSYEATLREVRHSVTESVRRFAKPNAAHLLSGGIDSSIIAAVALSLGCPLRTFTFAMRQPPKPELGPGSDVVAARKVAQWLGVPHRVIEIDRSRLIKNIPLAIYLAESFRGTIVDELAAHIEVARLLSAEGLDRILTGAGADDLFGTFPHALRYHRGLQLRAHLQQGLLKALPDELGLMQNIYSPWGISLVHPYWTKALREIGFHLPLRYRIDSRRLMKRVLRDAFADLLPAEVLARPKGVPRDCAQFREVLEQHFGDSPHRYRPIFRKLMKGRSRWLPKLSPTLSK